MAKGEITPKQARFVEEYLRDLNATQAAIRSGYSKKTAAQIARQLMQKTSVATAITAAQAKRSERTQIGVDDVLHRLWSIADADPNELVEFRRPAHSARDGQPTRGRRSGMGEQEEQETD
jgi:phage terminase small subunit